MSTKTTGNRGEWSEVYTFLKLLGDGKLYGADGDLKKREDIFYDIVEIIRNEEKGLLNFLFDARGKTVKIIDDKGDHCLKLSSKDFSKEAEYLYNRICESNQSAFEVEHTTEFMEGVLCKKLKAPAKNKADIVIKVHDFNTGLEPTLGFSIKSRLGKPSTLLNAGRNTNFIFEITGGFSDEEQDFVNGLVIKKKVGSREKDVSVGQRMDYFREEGYTLGYAGMTGTTFKNNLMLIDSDLPEIVAYFMLEYYLYGTTNICTVLDRVNENNPLQYDLSEGHGFYEYKFKKFLTESALGMLPGKVWTGKADANGGYIIVREDGEVLCYHLYNRNDFEDYLLKNTRFDRGGAGRHKYATVEKVDGKYYIKLNLQIRFIK